jgi:hypothetical protein
VILGNLKSFVHAFLDRYRRDNDYELGEAETLVQLKDCPQVDVSLTCSSFHFDCEIRRVQNRRRSESVPELHFVEVC